MHDLLMTVPYDMRGLLEEAAGAVHTLRKPLAISHIDADGITALAILVTMFERVHRGVVWKNIHQLNSETMEEVMRLVREHSPDLVVFSDLGTGQRALIEDNLDDMVGVERVIILDHHLPTEDTLDSGVVVDRIVEVNPCRHGLNGSYDVSGAGVAFLLALAVDPENYDLTELAVVGATGDLQDYYGKGFVGLNREILGLARQTGLVRITRDLTFFGVNTRPLPMLLEYSTEPYIPGLTGNRDACYAFFEALSIPVKDDDGHWRTWMDLSSAEKRRATQRLFMYILDAYDDPRVAEGIIGDVVLLVRRPQHTELANAKEFSTLLNACGRNRRPEVGVKVCLGDKGAYATGRTLLHEHRANLAAALRRLEENGYDERPGMYLVRDPETPDTIIGIVIGMAQGARIVPADRPVIGVSENTTDEGPVVKISGRARKQVLDAGVNLRDAFVRTGEVLNQKYGTLVVEAGGHPMAAGAFVRSEHLDEFLDGLSEVLTSMMASAQ